MNLTAPEIVRCEQPVRTDLPLNTQVPLIGVRRLVVLEWLGGETASGIERRIRSGVADTAFFALAALAEEITGFRKN